MSKSPAYLVMYTEVKKSIVNGLYAIGELLPTEAELEKQFDVSRTTVRRAMELLARDGLVEIKQGRGTMVLDYKTKQDLNKVTSVSESLKRRGYKVTTKSMHIDIIKATANIAKELDINQGDFVARVQRIQLADSRPVTIMKNYLPYNLVQGIELYINKFSALYQFIEERYGISIDGAKDKIYAKPADFAEAEMLNLKVGTALLCINRICFSNDKPVCVDNVAIVGDCYELEISMSGRYK
jgi:GntR family transcriptional regulator